MNREIKFRAKLLGNESWIIGGYWKHKKTMSSLGQSPSEDDYQHVIVTTTSDDWNLPTHLEFFEVEKDSVGQFTGLFDKNGVEIYEGDVVKFVGGTCSRLTNCHDLYYEIGAELLVRSLKSGFTLEGIDAVRSATSQQTLDSPNSGTKIDNYEFWNNAKSLVIISNIYENPEILSQ